MQDAILITPNKPTNSFKNKILNDIENNFSDKPRKKNSIKIKNII